MNVLKIIQNSPGIAVAQEHNGKWRVAAHDLYGLSEYMTVKELKNVFDRFKFSFVLYWRANGIEHSEHISKLSEEDIERMDKGI